MSIEYRKIVIPEDVGFPLDRIKVPVDTTLLVIRHKISSNADVEEHFHVKSKKPHNIAHTPMHSITPSLRKTLWRLNGANREKKNQNRRKRYEEKRKSETSEERESRLAKRRKWYAARKTKAFSDSNSEQTAPDSTEPESLSSVAPASFGRYLYELKEDINEVRCFHHYLKVYNLPVVDDDTVLRISADNDVATAIQMKAGENNEGESQASGQESDIQNRGVDEVDKNKEASW
ncbi:hypothetical protein FGB62_15g217 [Gracilaria domingensis]|nr:hypothetical protein FGB62_15g217 [Gracilaria domingensis]